MLHVVGAAVPVVGRDDALYGVLSVAAPDVRCGTGSGWISFVPILKRAAQPLAKHLAEQSAGGRGEVRATPLRHPS